MPKTGSCCTGGFQQSNKTADNVSSYLDFPESEKTGKGKKGIWIVNTHMQPKSNQSLLCKKLYSNKGFVDCAIIICFHWETLQKALQFKWEKSQFSQGSHLSSYKLECLVSHRLNSRFNHWPHVWTWLTPLPIKLHTPVCLCVYKLAHGVVFWTLLDKFSLPLSLVYV